MSDDDTGNRMPNEADAGFSKRWHGILETVQTSLQTYIGQRNVALLAAAAQASGLYREAVADPVRFHEWCQTGHYSGADKVKFDIRDQKATKRAMSRLVFLAVTHDRLHGRYKTSTARATTRSEWAGCIGYMGEQDETDEGKLIKIVKGMGGIEAAAKKFREDTMTDAEKADYAARVAARKAESPGEKLLAFMMSDATAKPMMDKLRESLKAAEDFGLSWDGPDVPDEADAPVDQTAQLVIAGRRLTLPPHIVGPLYDAILKASKPLRGIEDAPQAAKAPPPATAPDTPTPAPTPPPAMLPPPAPVVAPANA